MLRLDSMRIPTAPLGPDNPLPPIVRSADPHADVSLEQGDARLRANAAYGHLDSLLPYTPQDGYSRDRRPTDTAVAVLENDVLCATFLLEYGGRLWSLVHRPSGRELLHRNPILQPANLGLRNAWFAGGVEWNLGTTGHSPLTCEPMHAARVVDADGTPVLRMYEFERARRLVYLIDAWLPPGSPVLQVAVRITNPRTEQAPVYWWSNTAVPETDDVRVLAPAERAYHFDYERRLEVVDFPHSGGSDASYPANARCAGDWFVDCAGHPYPWIAALDGRGEGLVQASTRRLVGRKLFVWGRSAGGDHWQEFLSGPRERYLEIQAGLARTQFEHEPLPGGEHWSWVEAYGLLRAPAAEVHGDWPVARAAAEDAVNELVPGATLDGALTRARERFDREPQEILHTGSGWGALEELRRRHVHEPELGGTGTPFAPESLGPAQRPWVELLRTGRVRRPEHPLPPPSYVVGEEWADAIECAEDDWASWLHRGVLRWHAGDRAGAREAFEQSLKCEENPWAARNLGLAALLDGEPATAVRLLHGAHRSVPGLRPLTIELLDAHLQADLPERALGVIDGLPEKQRSHGRIRLLELRAALAAGHLDRAEGVLMDEDLVIVDLQEGEDSLASLWWAYHEARAEAATGARPDDDERVRVRTGHPLPKRLDFRMDRS